MFTLLAVLWFMLVLMKKKITDEPELPSEQALTILGWQNEVQICHNDLRIR